MHRQFESTSTRDRPAGQRQDEPAPAGRCRGAPERRTVVRFLSHRLRRRELRSFHRRRVLARVPVPPGNPGAQPGGRPRSPPFLRRPADRTGRPDAHGALHGRAARFLGPGGQAPRAGGREPEHDVQGHDGSGRGMAAAQDPPDRTAYRPAGKRHQPVRRDRQSGPSVV